MEYECEVGIGCVRVTKQGKREAPSVLIEIPEQGFYSEDLDLLSIFCHRLANHLRGGDPMEDVFPPKPKPDPLDEIKAKLEEGVGGFKVGDKVINKEGRAGVVWGLDPLSTVATVWIRWGTGSSGWTHYSELRKL